MITMKARKDVNDQDVETTGLVMVRSKLKEGTHDDSTEMEAENDEDKGEEEEEDDENHEGDDDNNDEEEEGKDNDDDKSEEELGNIEEIVSGDEAADEDSSTSSSDTVELEETDEKTKDKFKQGAYENFKHNNDDSLTCEHRHVFMHLAYEYNKNES